MNISLARRRREPDWIVLLATLVAILAAGSARAAAAPIDVREAARQHYDRGVWLFDRGQYPESEREFEMAYQAVPAFAVLYNIGQAQARQPRPREAIASLQRYLDEGADQILAERATDVRAQIAALERHAGEQEEARLAATGAPELNLDTSVASPAAAAPSDDFWRSRALRRTCAVGGATLTLASIAVYVWNRGRFQNWRAADQQLRTQIGEPHYQEQAVANNKLGTSIDRFNIVNLGLAITSGVLLAGGGTLWLIDRRW